MQPIIVRICDRLDRRRTGGSGNIPLVAATTVGRGTADRAAPAVVTEENELLLDVIAGQPEEVVDLRDAGLRSD